MEMEGLQRVFKSLTGSENDPDADLQVRKFGKADLEACFKKLGYEPQKVTDFGLSECEASGT